MEEGWDDGRGGGVMIATQPGGKAMKVGYGQGNAVLVSVSEKVKW